MMIMLHAKFYMFKSAKRGKMLTCDDKVETFFIDAVVVKVYSLVIAQELAI